MYKIIDEFPNWIRKVRNKEWKYNIIDKDWNLLSEL